MDPKNPPKEEIFVHCPICGAKYRPEDGHRCPDAEKEDEDEFDEYDVLSDLD